MSKNITSFSAWTKIPKDNKTSAEWGLTDFKCQFVLAEGDKGRDFKTQSKSLILLSILIFRHKDQQIFTSHTL